MQLSLKQIEAATMMAAGFKQADIAARVGVTVKTIQRWKDLEAFKEAVNQAKEGDLEIVPFATIYDTAKNKNEYQARADSYKEEYENIGSGLVKMSLLSIRLGLDAIARLNPEDIGIRQIESLARTAVVCGQLGLKLKQDFLETQKGDAELQQILNDGDDPEELIREHQRLLDALED